MSRLELHITAFNILLAITKNYAYIYIYVEVGVN